MTSYAGRMGLVTTTVRVSERTHAALGEIAERTGRSMQEVVGLAIGLSGLTGVAVGVWWATPERPIGPQLVGPIKKLPPAPALDSTMSAEVAVN